MNINADNGSARGKRGVLYITWGDAAREQRQRSITSLQAVHPELPVHVVELGENATLLDKAGMFNLSPFDTTLYLDSDTVILDRLDYGFEKAEQFGLACSICECPWARRYPSLNGDSIEYNTGVLFWCRRAEGVFGEWKTLAATVDSSIRFMNNGQEMIMPMNDQAGFALAIQKTGFNPFVLPFNWNFRPRWHRAWFGPVKIWHDYIDVPDGVRQWNARQGAGQRVMDFIVLNVQ